MEFTQRGSIQVMFEQSRKRGGVLRSENHLTPDHTPDEPVGRDAEVNRIVEAVKPLTHRKRGENLLVHGPAGVGKTTCVQHVFQQLEEESTTQAVYINCWQYDTRPALLTELLIELGYPSPRKGNPVDETLSRIQEFVEKSRGGVAVALDEFDRLQDPTEVVYDLHLISEGIDQNLSMVLVSNRQPTRLKLDPRSESRLSCQTLGFHPYDIQQLTEILEQRVQQAFRPGTVDDQVIETIAEQVAEQGGDCREALSQLLQLGRWADRNDIESIDIGSLENWSD